MGQRSDSELTELRRTADDLAGKRSERMTTGHLLAAIATHGGTAGELLLERRLDAEVLLKASRVASDDAADSVSRAMQRARDFAARSPFRDAGGLHLLFALCQERTTAAYRAIEQCGSDVTKLRNAAMQVAMGIAGVRRTGGTGKPAPQLLATGPAARQTARVAPAQPTQPSQQRPTQESKAAPSQKPSGVPTKVADISPPQERGGHVQQGPRGRRSSRPASAQSQSSFFELDPKQAPTLCQLGRNLTLAAERGELDPVVGREAEIERMLDILAKRQSRNPCLIGPSGVGKTTVVRGLARRIAEDTSLSKEDRRVIVEIEASSLVAGTAARGALVERLVQIKNEAKRYQGRVVVFFDPLDALFGNEAGDEASTELKSALSKGEFTCIGTSTPELFRKVIESDPVLLRSLSPIDVAELSESEALLALRGITPLFEKHHGVKFDADSTEKLVRWSTRYLPGRPLPDRAVSILDLAGARARRHGSTSVLPKDVGAVFSELSQVPLDRLLETDHDRMLRLEELLATRIVGHTAPLARIAAVLRRNASGFHARRPIGSFLLLGPSGVGKTETAKAIAECLFFSPHAMTRLDLSEYAESHSIARLVGAPPGYVGHEAGGQLTEAIRKKPYQVVLLDEIEKAHRDVLEAFLQVFDEGRLTDGRGRTIDFTNTVILLTSNLGADIARPRTGKKPIGFGSVETDESHVYEDALIGAARSALPPELFNRFDEVLAFGPLSRKDVAEIAARMLETLADDVRESRGVYLEIDPAAIEALLDSGGFDPELGARPMRRAIARLVEAPLGDMILRGELTRGDRVFVRVGAGGVVLDRSRKATLSRPS